MLLASNISLTRRENKKNGWIVKVLDKRKRARVQFKEAPKSLMQQHGSVLALYRKLEILMGSADRYASLAKKAIRAPVEQDRGRCNLHFLHRAYSLLNLPHVIAFQAVKVSDKLVCVYNIGLFDYHIRDRGHGEFVTIAMFVNGMFQIFD